MKKTRTVKAILDKLLTGLGRVLSLSALLLAANGLRPLTLSAEVPVKFTYQGNLRQSGYLVNGQRSMVFRIYASSTSATELWASPAYNVNLSTGVFRVALEPVIADWQSGGLWLELEIESNRLSPREELTSSPYAINSLLLSGKKYTSGAAAPAAPNAGDLWMNTALNVLYFWNGSGWTSTAGSGAAHAVTHAGGGIDAITSLGTHTVTGAAGYGGDMLVLSTGTSGVIRLTGAGGVYANRFYGDGSGLKNINASEVASGWLSGDRLAPGVIVSTHVMDLSLDKSKLAQSGCALNDMLRWNGTQWVCLTADGPEADPLSIHNQATLQAGTTFYVSSGTVNDLYVDNSLKVTGMALLKGAPGQQGLSVEATGNVGIGMTGAAARLEIKGSDAQNYSLAVGTGTAHQVVVSTSGAVGIGTENPAAKLDVTGNGGPGQYIAVFNSGSKPAAWLRNK